MSDINFDLVFEELKCIEENNKDLYQHIKEICSTTEEVSKLSKDIRDILDNDFWDILA